MKVFCNSCPFWCCSKMHWDVPQGKEQVPAKCYFLKDFDYSHKAIHLMGCIAFYYSTSTYCTKYICSTISNHKLLFVL